ncbi:hypothetical protein TPAU25S_02179 [Tsukamurella paurometabola]|uniref:DUF3089 domain-containing protein n=1 Tax=Tsukamurella paurometabola (strain ATCC 8368 / DSM 20162 / CCUG 35730 / CIP 100753 / JCM 10117 / KCTC 9821 / NBRC 16120 / NCIMB 702349 / NCTC 13040) TaxID=521096 RepID=D5UT53_TSUPD|nr:DUF3089 domain-containing protein [Tsukamurella paurometabola]ADG77340.1 conserved hypothetical protein [Tsukamurella paurometabola DSM 20162]SUP43537.1 Protein of uncharacterised function (DUF3089) [Tsukamurella paurometabola]
MVLRRIGGRVAAVLAAAALSAALAGGVAQGTPSTLWMCRPGTANPCTLPLDTTDLSTGQVTTPAKPTAGDQKVDCFYVYPTVTNQVAPNANPVRMPEVDSIARFQAARFSSMCRVFAPIYPQITILGLAPAMLLQLKQPMQTAYTSVRDAWREYLARDNKGRGVVFIGHSQGSMMLRKLIREEIDRVPAVRDRVVGALLIGGNVTTAAGSTTGGDFQNLPLCTRRGQFGCVIGFSTDLVAPVISLFGNTDIDLLSQTMDLPRGAGYRVACTDPGPLAGETGPVPVTVPSEPYSFGIISTLMGYTTFPEALPTSTSTWTASKGRGIGACEYVNRHSMYRITMTTPQPINELPLLSTHLLDMNFGLDRLVSIARQQSQAWLKR